MKDETEMKTVTEEAAAGVAVMEEVAADKAVTEDVAAGEAEADGTDPEDVVELRRCRRCLLYELADKSQYESVKSYLDSVPSSEKVPNEVYHTRLSLCRECDMLLAGMCRKCGCYVEVRAAMMRSSCPKTVPMWDRAD